jgi:hypothetical protein
MGIEAWRWSSGLADDWLTGRVEEQCVTAATRACHRPGRNWPMQGDQLGQNLDTIGLVVGTRNIAIERPNRRSFHDDAPAAAWKFARPARELIEVMCRKIGGLLDATSATELRRWV